SRPTTPAATTNAHRRSTAPRNASENGPTRAQPATRKAASAATSIGTDGPRRPRAPAPASPLSPGPVAVLSCMVPSCVVLSSAMADLHISDGAVGVEGQDRPPRGRPPRIPGEATAIADGGAAGRLDGHLRRDDHLHPAHRGLHRDRRISGEVQSAQVQQDFAGTHVVFGLELGHRRGPVLPLNQSGGGGELYGYRPTDPATCHRS